MSDGKIPQQVYELTKSFKQRTFKIDKFIATSWARGWHLYNTLLGKQHLKMLVLDLDGTALNDQKEMTPENVEAIVALKKRNPSVLICIATGRGFHQALRFADEIKADIFITDNGGALYKRKNDGYELAGSFRMLGNEVEAICNKIGSFGDENSKMIWHLSTDSMAHNFITGAGKEMWQKAHNTFYPGEIFGEGVLQVENFTQIKELDLRERAIKVCVDFGEDKIGKKQFAEFEKYLKNNKINYFQTSDSKLEIAPPRVNKGETLLTIINEENKKGNFINRKDVLALGDSDNDRPMFEKGFQSLCPDNAREEIKKLEEMVSLKETNNEPFVKCAIDSFQTKSTPRYWRVLNKKVALPLKEWSAKAKRGLPLPGRINQGKERHFGQNNERLH